ncbi:FecCD family ABC transporter permease [Enterococcus casseliflavus]|uniref:Iron chelate uptake ABC transporter family permease subunit n=1 Tax=Enterococcus casseliflavus TaxID=37734 RepID=A0ABD6YZF4_ENTCA|nr:iron ABC transporter permease [Enterococcus casseliflavus]QGN29550.1 iron chelate uptake ABC transporter family permease subunit [Enterococcus casseliflavus]
MIYFKAQKLWILLPIILVVSILVSAKLGSVPISLAEISQILIGKTTVNYSVFVNIRLPRICFSIFSGINLALAGLILQTVLKNSMADPGIMGISSGAALGATLMMLVLPLSVTLVPMVAFCGGMIAFLVILIFAWERNLSPLRLVLSGVAVNAIIGGFQATLMTVYSDKLQGVVTWLNGDLSGKTWEQVGLLTTYSIPIIVLLFMMSKRMNVMNLSDKTIQSLGVNIRQSRLFFSGLAVFLAGVTVSQVGLISFVGLIVPHIGKLLVGGNMKKLLPCTVLLGGIVMTMADLIARVVISPLELPVGTVMSVLGGPFFLFLLSKQKRGE